MPTCHLDATKPNFQHMLQKFKATKVVLVPQRCRDVVGVRQLLVRARAVGLVYSIYASACIVKFLDVIKMFKCLSTNKNVCTIMQLPQPWASIRHQGCEQGRCARAPLVAIVQEAPPVAH